jgi:8-oxo-dGTP pyrophosphatase MutT (NUDIX family)
MPSASRRRRSGCASARRPCGSRRIKTEKKIVERTPAPASVLIPIVLRDVPTVLLTQRTDHLNDHPSQISFPGGRTEPGDADAVATALREAEEEIGLDATWIEVLGSLPIYTTSTGFIVTPVVALVRPGFACSPTRSRSPRCSRCRWRG